MFRVPAWTEQWRARSYAKQLIIASNTTLLSRECRLRWSPSVSTFVRHRTGSNDALDVCKSKVFPNLV